MTGDIPKVGEGSANSPPRCGWPTSKMKAVSKWADKTYQVELVIEDNESKAESAVKANTKMITEDDVLMIVGPQSSKQAIPAGECG